MSKETHASGLANVKKIAGSVSIKEVGGVGMLDMRGDTQDKAFVAAVKKVLKTGLPIKPRTSATKDEITILWLSIDQWLVLCPLEKAADLKSRLVQELGRTHSFVVNVSDARTIIRLSGKGSREVLMKGGSVDFMGPEIKTGMVRRMQFAELAALVYFVSAKEEIIDLFVFRSYANYTWEWLAETSKTAAEIRVFVKQAVAKI